MTNPSNRTNSAVNKQSNAPHQQGMTGRAELASACAYSFCERPELDPYSPAVCTVA